MNVFIKINIDKSYRQTNFTLLNTCNYSDKSYKYHIVLLAKFFVINENTVSNNDCIILIIIDNLLIKRNKEEYD